MSGRSSGERGHLYADPCVPLEGAFLDAIDSMRPRIMGVEVRRTFLGRREELRIPEREGEEALRFDIAVGEAPDSESFDFGSDLFIFADLVASGLTMRGAVSLLGHVSIMPRDTSAINNVAKEAVGAWASPVIYDASATALRSLVSASRGAEELIVPLIPRKVRLHALVRKSET